MSYYRYITGVYKSYWPQLNRTLRSSSVPRHIPEIDSSRYTRSCSVPPSAFGSDSFLRGATPFRDRAASVPPAHAYTWERNSALSAARETGYCIPKDYSYTRRYSSNTSSSASSSSANYSHYTDFDHKVIDYQSNLDTLDSVRNYVTTSRRSRADYRDGDYRSGFASKYNFYDGGKHGSDYLYQSSADVLGSWKHYNLSAQTINERNTRAKSPLVTRELDRYYETRKRSDYIGDVSSGPAKDFRFYSYRRVPYFGGSDGYQYVNKYLQYLDASPTGRLI